MGATVDIYQASGAQKTAYGTDITIKYATGNMLSLLTHGVTNQSGTGDQSPDNIRPIHGVTYAEKWEGTLAGGRNLLRNTGQDTIVTSPNDNPNYPVWCYKKIYSGLINGKTYSFSAEIALSDSSKTKGSLRIFQENGNHQAFSIPIIADGTRQSCTFTVPNDGISYNAMVYAGVAGVDQNVTATYHHMKLEVGASATDYSPAPEDLPSYQKIMLPHELFDSDSYDFVTGQGQAKKNKAIFDGSPDEAWAYNALYETSSNVGYARFQLPMAFSAKNKIESCDRLKIVLNGAWQEESEHIENDAYGINIVVEKSRMSGWLDSWTVAQKDAAFKTLLASNPVTVVYELATPQPITGTPQTISLSGHTTITNDGGGQMEVTYTAAYERLAKTSRAFDCHVVHELMRWYTLSFDMANTDSVRRYIAPGISLVCKDQMYDLAGYKKESGSNNSTTVSAEHVAYRLLNYNLPAGYAFVGTVAQIAADILDKSVSTGGTKASTEFRIGTTPDLGTISFSLNNTDAVTAKYAIMALKNSGAESDCDNFTINFSSAIGGGQTQTFEFGVNMADVSITYDKSNGTTYEVDVADLQIIDPEDHSFDIGWYGHGVDSTTGEEFTKRIINYDRCIDNPTQNKIALGVFVSDVSTQTAQMSIDIDNNASAASHAQDTADAAKAGADNSVQIGTSYNNVDITHEVGFRSTSGNGTQRILSNGTDGFVIQQYYNSVWVTVYQAAIVSGKTTVTAYNLAHTQKVIMGGDFGFTTWVSSDGTTWAQTGGMDTSGGMGATSMYSLLNPDYKLIMGKGPGQYDGYGLYLVKNASTTPQTYFQIVPNSGNAVYVQQVINGVIKSELNFSDDGETLTLGTGGATLELANTGFSARKNFSATNYIVLQADEDKIDLHLWQDHSAGEDVGIEIVKNDANFGKCIILDIDGTAKVLNSTGWH